MHRFTFAIPNFGQRTGKGIPAGIKFISPFGKQIEIYY